MSDAAAGLDSAQPIAGLYDSPWPAEDGGPRRQMIPRAPGLGLRAGERLRVTSRPCFMPTMPVLREPGEVFVQGHSPPDGNTTAWLERIDPLTLEPAARSPELAGGPFWPGGVLAHANGSLYVTYGRYCHKLDADCHLLASCELPRQQPYNSLLVLSDGALVMKNFVRDGSERSFFTLLEPDRLESIGPEIEIPEGSIARISKEVSPAGELVYVVGDHTIFRYRYDAGRLERDPDWVVRYRVRPDGEQSYGWDPVIAGGHVWFMDNGDNVFNRSFAAGGVASGPLHLVRVSSHDCRDWELFTPFALPHGTIVNPPLVDPTRRVVVAYDSGNARLAGFRFHGSGQFERLWEQPFGAANHFLLCADTGEIAVNDFRDETEHVVVLDIETGHERGRVAIGSPVQSVLFQSPGFGRDLYVCTFTTLARVFVNGE